MSSDDADVNAAVEGELRLLEPRVRSSPELAAALLDPEFTEVGSSGRRWDRAAMLAALPTLPGTGDAPGFRVRALTGTRPAPGLVHLTYETVRDGRRVRRSSLWRRGADGAWRMYYHQGTPVPDGTP